ncbi:MAG: SDR family oxidoreductase [Longicatena sp.]
MKNRIAIVTGAASGMGEAVTKKFIESGAKVIGFSLENEASFKHENFNYIKGDITNFSDCEKVVAYAIEKYGKIDSLVNCAGIVKEGNIETTSSEQFEFVFKVNTFGTFNICKAAIPYLKLQKSTIVNISSDMSILPLKDRIAYNPSKAAVNMLTKCIALDYAPNVRCNAILPGVIFTPMIQKRLDNSDNPKELMEMYKGLYPLERIGAVEDIVNGVMFLSSTKSDWITGIELPICGGPI